jgi:hypothetical protein
MAPEEVDRRCPSGPRLRCFGTAGHRESHARAVKGSTSRNWGYPYRPFHQAALWSGRQPGQPRWDLGRLMYRVGVHRKVQ